MKKGDIVYKAIVSDYTDDGRPRVVVSSARVVHVTREHVEIRAIGDGLAFLGNKTFFRQGVEKVLYPSPKMAVVRQAELARAKWNEARRTLNVILRHLDEMN